MIFSRANIATFSTSLAIQFCGLITGILTARILGPTARGELATVMLWPMILSNLGLLGCNWALAREVALGSLDPGLIAEEHISSHLYTAGMPDPDLLIRTAGEIPI